MSHEALMTVILFVGIVTLGVIYFRYLIMAGDMVAGILFMMVPIVAIIVVMLVCEFLEMTIETSRRLKNLKMWFFKKMKRV